MLDEALGCEASLMAPLSPSYLSRLEQRLEEIESTMRGLQQAQSATQLDTACARQFAKSSLPSAPDSTVPPEPSAPYSANAEMGEIDTSEDAIDGMGAIKFTDEEDCGYFGMESLLDSPISCQCAPGCSPTLKVRRPMSLLYAISRWRLLKQAGRGKLSKPGHTLYPPPPSGCESLVHIMCKARSMKAPLIARRQVSTSTRCPLKRTPGG